jgi:GH24 family phage-related lysozyme (muramidase)
MPPPWKGRESSTKCDFLNLTNLRLDPAYIEVLFKADVRESIAELQDHIPELDTYPKMAQLGLLDLLFNLGHDRFFGNDIFTGFPKLRTALTYRNWKEVAEESHRKEKDDKGEIMGGVVKRNKFVREWFLKAGEEDPFFVNPNCGPPKNVSAIVG